MVRGFAWHAILGFALLFMITNQSLASVQPIADDPLKSVEKEWKMLFEETVEWFNFGYFQNALRGFKRLLIKDKNNSNINFYMAMCYYNLRRPADIIIPYLEKAVVKVNPYYSYSYKEDAAPVFAWLYLGQMYMLNYKFNEAENAFTSFKGYLTERSRDAAYIEEVNLWLMYCGNAKLHYANPLQTVTVNNLKIANSDYNEFKPYLTDDGTKLYLSSDRKGSQGGQYLNDKFKSDVYVMSFKSGKWGKPKKMAYRINSNNADLNSSLSAAGQSLCFSREDRNNKDYNIYIAAVRDKSRFNAPEIMNPNINTKSNETNAYILISGSIMYFASDKPGGYGGKDIYMAEKMPNGEWGRPYNLGPQVNTAMDDDFPFVLDDGLTLYFSSKGHSSMGGFDIFVTTLSDEGVWSTPDNLGYPINTTSDDTGFMLSKDGSRGFYSSARGAADNGYVDNLDIYEVLFSL